MPVKSKKANPKDFYYKQLKWKHIGFKIGLMIKKEWNLPEVPRVTVFKDRIEVETNTTISDYGLDYLNERIEAKGCRIRSKFNNPYIIDFYIFDKVRY